MLGEGLGVKNRKDYDEYKKLLIFAKLIPT
jgi:hypothetical protein